MVATPAAETLYPKVSHWLADLATTIAGLNDDVTMMRGSVRVGSPNGFGSRVLVDRIGSFTAAHPEVRFQLRLGTTGRLLDLLHNDEISLAVIPGDPALGDHLVAEALPFCYSMDLVCSPSLFADELRGRRGRYGRLVELDHVVLWRGENRVREWYWRNYRKRPNLKFVLEVDNIFAAISAARDGKHLALLPSDVIESELATKALVYAGPRSGEALQPYRLASLRKRAPHLAESKFAEFIRG